MSAWTIPTKSLDAVALAGGSGSTGAVVDLDEVKPNHAMEVLADEEVVGGNGGQAILHLEGSLDGTNFYTMSTYVTPNGLVGTVVTLVSVTDYPARYVRCTGINSQGSSTVTTWHTSGS